jgi:pimeloyl-ACP methyl ester carboxylesterase
MPRRLLAALALAALLPLPVPVHAASPAAPAKTVQRWQGKLAPCTLPERGGTAFCGTYEVFENRESRSGRKIPLKIVVLPATGPNRAPDPVFFLEGGPGAAATMDAAELAGDPVRARRDIVLVDTRGTGESNPLSCPIWNDGIRLDHIFPLDAVTACRDELQKRADLSRYTTPAAMDDVDEVRRYLGYGPVNLSGASYGTFAAQIFLARHPEAVRTVALASVVKPGEPAPPESRQECPAGPGAPRPRLCSRAGLPRRLPPLPGRGLDRARPAGKAARQGPGETPQDGPAGDGRAHPLGRGRLPPLRPL